MSQSIRTKPVLILLQSVVAVRRLQAWLGLASGTASSTVRAALGLVAVGLCVSLVAACAVFRSYHLELGQTLDLVSAGKIDAAIGTHESHAGDRDEKDLLYFLEKGELLRLAGRYSESQQAWLEADRRVAVWEEQARLHPEMLLRDAGSLLVNDKTRAYPGQDFEKVMLTTRIALNHLALGEWDEARVAIKRTHEREALIAALRAKQVRRSEQAAGESGYTRDFRELNGYPVETIDSPEINALRNSYQNAFSHYLAGFLYEALGETSLASAGYRQAIELQPGVALLEDGLAGLDARQAQRRKVVADSTVRTDLLVVVETGLAPARRSVNINLPIVKDEEVFFAPISFPVLESQAGPAGAREIVVGEMLQAEGADITSVDLMSRRALKDEMPWIVLRAVTRATVKVALQKAASEEEDSRTARAATKIGSIVTEQADERAWRSLPAEIAVARVRVEPGIHDIGVDVGGMQHRYRVNLDGPFAVMSVRQIGATAYMSISPASSSDATLQRANTHGDGQSRHRLEEDVL
ncbi:MAG: hypothetical protein JSU95_09185 [Betaproteobacteria bacterium]|nr:MAG: hypothetical protein JSU95_09185 [Betaproteobacteria bacterium]